MVQIKVIYILVKKNQRLLRFILLIIKVLIFNTLIVLKVFVAGVAQLVEHHLAKVDVEGSNPFARSILFFKDGIQFPFELSPAYNNIAEIIW